MEIEKKVGGVPMFFFFFFTFLYFFALSFSQGPESGVFTFKDNFIRIVPRKRFYRRKKNLIENRNGILQT